MGNNALAMAATRIKFDLILLFAPPEQQVAKTEKIINRVGESVNFHPPFNPVNGTDLGDHHRLFRGRHPALLGSRRFFDQLGNALGQLGALSYPVLNTRSIYTQTLFVTAGDRVEETYALDETTIARSATVSYCQVVKRALFRAAACQTNSDHSCSNSYILGNRQGDCCEISEPEYDPEP